MHLLAALSLATQLALSGHLHDGLKALDAKQYDAAISSLTKVVDEKDAGNPFREVGLHYRAEAYRAKGDKEKALADWTTLLKATRNDQLRAPALAGFKAVGGDPKQLLPTDSPTAVWEKFLAAAEGNDIAAAKALSTGMWLQQVAGTEGRALVELSKYIAGNERIGERSEAGRAWIELSREGSRSGVLLEFVLDQNANAWLISSFSKTRRGNGRAAANISNLKQLGLRLLVWVEEHNGRLPDKLDALKDSQTLLWADPQNPEDKRPFEYCAGLSTKDDSSKLVAAAPVAVSGSREVLFLDGSTRVMKEDDFLAAARVQRWLVPGAATKDDLPKEKQDEVRQLVSQLSHAEFKVRNTARTKLQAMGAIIFPVLEEFRDAADPEIRATVRELLEGK